MNVRRLPPGGSRGQDGQEGRSTAFRRGVDEATGSVVPTPQSQRRWLPRRDGRTWGGVGHTHLDLDTLSDGSTQSR